MPGKYSNNDEKARILAWSKQNALIKIICKHKRRGRLTIMKLLSSAKGLPSNAVPKHKFGGGRRKKTSYRHLFEDRNPEETSVKSTGYEKFAS